MPLRNIDWETNEHRSASFLFDWSASVADALNAQLLASEQRFFAEIACRTRIKTAEEVARFNHGPPATATAHENPEYEPPAPVFTAPARFADRFGVNVIELPEERRVAAVVLLVGEDHKADSDGALAFAVRAAGLMLAGVGVGIVDILPGPASWATHLHSLTGVYPAVRRPRGGEATVLVVQPEVRDGIEQFAVWYHAVALGAPLPTVPVPVCGARHLKLDLEATYTEACQRSRLP